MIINEGLLLQSQTFHMIMDAEYTNGHSTGKPTFTCFQNRSTRAHSFKNMRSLNRTIEIGHNLRNDIIPISKGQNTI